MTKKIIYTGIKQDPLDAERFEITTLYLCIMSDEYNVPNVIWSAVSYEDAIAPKPKILGIIIEKLIDFDEYVNLTDKDNPKLLQIQSKIQEYIEKEKDNPVKEMDEETLNAILKEDAGMIRYFKGE